MTTKEKIAVMQASEDGRNIEFKRNRCDEWITCPRDSLLWNWTDGTYRIKPEPKLRPWKPEDIKIGSLLRNVPPHEGNDYLAHRMIIGVFGAWVTFAGMGVVEQQTTQFLFNNNCQCSSDGGLTWRMCGVEE